MFPFDDGIMVLVHLPFFCRDKSGSEIYHKCLIQIIMNGIVLHDVTMGISSHIRVYNDSIQYEKYGIYKINIPPPPLRIHPVALVCPLWCVLYFHIVIKDHPLVKIASWLIYLLYFSAAEARICRDIRAIPLFPMPWFLASAATVLSMEHEWDPVFKVTPSRIGWAQT